MFLGRPKRGPGILACLWRALGMFKSCSGHMSGIANITSVYKRNAEHTPLAIGVLSSFQITVFECRMPPEGKGHGKTTHCHGRKPPRKIPQVVPQVSSSMKSMSAELLSYTGILNVRRHRHVTSMLHVSCIC